MNEKKFFHQWVKSHFHGLSPATLCQVLGYNGKDYEPFPLHKMYIDEAVYCDLFQVATGRRTDNNVNKYYGIQEICKIYFENELHEPFTIVEL